MTDYRVIEGVKKRNFTIHAKMPEISSTAITRINADDTYIARNGDAYIARNGDTYIAHNTTPNVYPRVIGGVRKRSFRIQAKVTHG